MPRCDIYEITSQYNYRNDHMDDTSAVASNISIARLPMAAQEPAVCADINHQYVRREIRKFRTDTI